MFQMPGVHVLPFAGKLPVLAPSVLLASGTCISGDIVMGEESSCWFNVAMRGDVNEIRIGARTNIQDNSVVHVTSGGHGTYIGHDVTVGHNAILHACTVEDECLVGMGAIILDGVVVKKHCFVAAGALLTPGKVFPEGSMIVGSPAVVKRALTQKEITDILLSAQHYVALRTKYIEELRL